MKVLICVVLFTVGAAVQAQQDYQDYWQNDLDDYNFDKSDENTDVKQAENTQAEVQDVPDQTEAQTKPESAQQDYHDYWQNDLGDYNFDNSNENTDVKQEETAQAEVQDVPEQTEAETEPESDKFDDYQIEDNRSGLAEKEQVEEPAASEQAQEHRVLPIGEPEQSDEDLQEHGLDDGTWGEAVDDIAPLPIPEADDNNDNIFEETKDILNQDQDYLDKLEEEPVGDDTDMDKIIEETKKLLAESDDAFEEDDYDNSDEQEKSDENVVIENDEENEEDTPAKVYADLDADLDKLFETLGKLGDNNSNENANTDEEGANDVKDYEEKYGKPYKEDIALSWRNAEVDAAELEGSKQNEEIADDNNDEAADENVASAEAAEDDDYENIDDSNLSQIFAEYANSSNENAEKDAQDLLKLDVNNEENATDTTAASLKKIEGEKEASDYVDNYDEPRDSEPNADDDIDSLIKQIFSDDIKEPQSYGNDALVDEKQPKEENAEEFGRDEVNTTNADMVDTKQKSMMVDDLNSAQLSDLMTQFVDAHKEDFDVNSENFAKHIKPIHITLSVDEPTVVTSPDYPEPYPTNNIIDWVFDGPGMGIEMNITSFAVNGALGDYLLVKPGGLDASGTEGLVFSHRLIKERRYRFADVNRMFVRFEAKPGWQFQKGFSFSVKLIWPLPTFGDEEPEAEAVANPPVETLTLNLAGLTLPKFNEIREQFLELLADMAKQYIKDNNITLGLNTTLEVTQITRTAVCNIQWPEYENCVELTFGVPLHYEEEPEEPRLNARDLDDMWTSNIIKEEFSERLRSLGITEYAIPDDRTVLMVWMVIAAGVMISMAMLAFALWRFSCFEDYTRMQVYGDTDSIQSEKRNLDLYPTPHQTLPPLYSENDFKWTDDKYDDSTRVDMGGFANRSYNRDDIYDLESDDDVIIPRERKGAISPGHNYSGA